MPIHWKHEETSSKVFDLKKLSPTQIIFSVRTDPERAARNEL